MCINICVPVYIHTYIYSYIYTHAQEAKGGARSPGTAPAAKVYICIIRKSICMPLPWRHRVF